MDDRVNIIELKDASPLAKVISSSNAQNILAFIGNNDKSTASTIKNELSLPASTVHYNLKALIKAGILDDSNFSYSSKGKEIIHYSLTDKLIIVVPQKKNVSSRIKAIIPGLLTVGAVAGLALIIKLFSRGFGSIGASSNSFMDVDLAKNAVTPRLMEASVESGSFIANCSTVASKSVPWFASRDFFIGLGVAIVVLLSSYFLIQFIKNKNNKKQKKVSKHNNKTNHSKKNKN